MNDKVYCPKQYRDEIKELEEKIKALKFELAAYIKISGKRAPEILDAIMRVK